MAGFRQSLLLSRRPYKLQLQLAIGLAVIYTVLTNVLSIRGSAVVDLEPLQDMTTASKFERAPRQGNNQSASAVSTFYTPPIEDDYFSGGPTFLLGILTVKDEVERRKAVRETYLSFYQDLYLDDANRICSLVNVQRQRVPLRECQLIYVFVVGGGNDNAPTVLVAPNASFPITLNGTTTLGEDDEDDVIYLNIRENLEDGKSQTFFKYASMIAKDVPIDYIGKIDSDTLLFVPAFLDFITTRQPLPRRPHNRLVYGGNPHGATACDPNIEDTHPCPLDLVGDVYMGGSFYWMSPDLADFISSDLVQRSQLAIRHEDVDIGNFVFTYSQVYKDAPRNVTIHTARVPGSRMLIHRVYDGNWMFRNRATSLVNMLWAHSLDDSKYPGAFFKDLRNYRKVWRQFQAYWLSNRALITSDIFELYDLPDAPGKHFVRTNDYIYSHQDDDSSPIVIENYKLIFFPVEGVQADDWRRLTRRILGFEDWREKANQHQGLVYLSDFPPEVASDLMTRPDYTRAMFVREPKLRLLSAYFEHVLPDRGDNFKQMCCKALRRCYDSPEITFDHFVNVIRDCDQPYWRPQANRMEPKYFQYINFVGHYDTIQEDAKRLLQKVGAWGAHGQTGWGKTNDQPIFSQVQFLSDPRKVQTFYDPEVEKAAQKLYRNDYNAKNLFNFSRKLQLEPATDDTTARQE